MEGVNVLAVSPGGRVLASITAGVMAWERRLWNLDAGQIARHTCRTSAATTGPGC